ncbi:ABC transporter permease, partial [Romboutsia sp.]|uniref:ABC transporter permease n=1 Tax=Romboutsia sp. TaxID=1965302 RepID=UPI002B7AB635
MINGLSKYDVNNLSEKYKPIINKYFSYSLTNIKKEDINLYNEIIENRKEAFEKEYKNLELELREYKEVDFTNKGSSNKITLFKDSKDINLSFIEEGNKPKYNNEIAITKMYAKKNDIHIGDKISIKGKEYTVSGMVLFSDNTLPISGSDFIIDNSKITLGLVNDEEYENIKGKEMFHFSGVVKGKNEYRMINEDFKRERNEILNDFNKEVNKTYRDKEDLNFITNITLTENQMRSGAIYEELKGGQGATIGISIIISSIAVMIVLILVYKVVKNEKTQIGLLKAIGYSRYDILTPYIVLLFIIAFPMLLLGYIGGIYAAYPMKNFYLEFYLIPDGNIKTNISVLFVSIIVPIVVIIGLCAFIINKMLSKKAIDLLKVSEKEKISKLNKFVNKLLKNAKPQTKFKYSFIFANTSKFFVFFIGIIFSSMLIIMSFMMSDFFDKMVTEYYESVDYVYEGYIDLTKDYPKLQDNQEKFIIVENAQYKDENISIRGISKDNNLHRLFDKRENDITKNLINGVIVNNSFSIMYDIKVGDKIKISINDKQYERKVTSISKDYSDPKAYFEIDDLSKIIVDANNTYNLDDDEFYNGVYSKEKLNEKEYASIINKEDIMEQSQLMQGFIKVSIYGMIFSAIFIAVIVLYVLTTLTIEDNYYSISLLKVMGYNKKEVNSMMLNSYLIYSIVSYLISIPITVYGFGAMIKYMGKVFKIVMPFEFEIWHGIVGLIAILFIFIIGSRAAKKRIETVPLQEVLKAYSE